MKTWKIVHREELVGWYYVEAETAEDAMEEWKHRVENGQVDFGDMEMVNSDDVVEEVM